jgi:hypothetical protein
VMMPLYVKKAAQPRSLRKPSISAY